MALFIKPSVVVTEHDPLLLQKLERNIRLCYKSEANTAKGSAVPLLRKIINSKHLAMLDHASITVNFKIDRGISHELVRHRIAAYAQESTRYCNYKSERFGSELTFIRPCFWNPAGPEFAMWSDAMYSAEKTYMSLINAGAKPGEARSVLPISLKTEVAATLDITSWRHVFSQRCALSAHQQFRQVAIPLLRYLQAGPLGVLFEDLTYNTDFPERDYAEVSTYYFDR